MFAVIFEVQPKADRWDEYLGLARLLKPEIEQIDGFIDNERFASRRTKGRLLSLSTWRDEKAVIRWRTQAVHHGVQEKGRFAVFEDYHLRVGEVSADTHAQVLAAHRFDATEVGAAKVVTITELPPRAADIVVPESVVDQEVFESIYNPGKRLVLASWQDAAAAGRWTPSVTDGVRHRQVRVIRDYGMFDRREAPQYYPVVPRDAG
ncbi:MAG: antibiotic biosynthesis monooxygenase [Acetobacteraceae bacterium]|nr:antibiotic biosynthesis monooxygenase [Acetobacteraceae bacterium]